LRTCKPAQIISAGKTSGKRLSGLALDRPERSRQSDL
jgi:hypothetical protein